MRHLLAIVVLASLLMVACRGNKHVSTSHLHAGEMPDTLKVATLYSPTSYFIYREEEMGLDYSLVKRLAEDKDMALEITVAPNLQAMIEMLDTGAVDLIAYPVPMTAEFKDRVIATGPVSETHQVLVQPRRASSSLIKDVTELPGHDVWVEDGSKYYYRMVNLNEELGGGIGIHVLDRDTIITEDLIEMVSDGTIPLTVIDSDIARLNKTYYPNLDVELALSFPQRSAWGVNVNHRWLADSIDTWMSSERPQDAHARLLRRYFELSKNEPAGITIDFTKGRISPYDALFKKHAAAIDYDWRLLAAQGYVESQFDSTRVSWAGARGIMQIMPGTARAYGSSPEAIVNPDEAIATSTLILKSLNKSLASRVEDPEERMKFILGAYNSGLAHIYDAIALAEKLGYNPQVWDGNVAECLLLKSKPEYYNDPVCKFGYFRGRQTVAYVQHVMSFYTRAKQYIHR